MSELLVERPSVKRGVEPSVCQAIERYLELVERGLTTTEFDTYLRECVTCGGDEYVEKVLLRLRLLGASAEFVKRSERNESTRKSAGSTFHGKDNGMNSKRSATKAIKGKPSSAPNPDTESIRDFDDERDLESLLGGESLAESMASALDDVKAGRITTHNRRELPTI